MTALMSPLVTGRSLVSHTLFDRLTRRIVAEERMERELAERIVDQSLAFLAACAQPHELPLAPSGLVDIGWHVFLLHTRDYATFCDRVAGRYLHHQPTAEDDPAASGRRARATLARTVAAIQAAGFAIDDALWPRASGDQACTGCHNGCHDDPPPAR